MGKNKVVMATRGNGAETIKEREGKNVGKKEKESFVILEEELI